MTRSPEPTQENVRAVEEHVGDRVDHYAGQAARSMADKQPQELKQALSLRLDRLQAGSPTLAKDRIVVGRISVTDLTPLFAEGTVGVEAVLGWTADHLPRDRKERWVTEVVKIRRRTGCFSRVALKDSTFKKTYAVQNKSRDEHGMPVDEMYDGSGNFMAGEYEAQQLFVQIRRESNGAEVCTAIPHSGFVISRRAYLDTNRQPKLTVTLTAAAVTISAAPTWGGSVETFSVQPGYLKVDGTMTLDVPPPST